MDTPVSVLTTTEAVSAQLELLMEQARAGHDVTITVDGQPVARLQPPERGGDLHEWLEEAASLRQHLKAEGVAPFSADDIRSLVDEGRKPLA